MADQKTNILTIRTPEGIEFPLQLAGPLTRCMAWLVDIAVISAMMTVLKITTAFLGIIAVELTAAVNVIGYFVISVGYGMFTEWYWRGQTLGKRLLRLRVMDQQGLRLQSNQIVIRNLMRFVDSLPLFYMVGGLASLANRKAQRLGDVVANTIVVWQPEIGEPDLDQILAGKYNSFRDYPHLAARLRQRVSIAEAGLALKALVRRESLEPASRIILFKDIAGHFKRILAFPQETTDGISDEQYVRNVVDLLYRSRRSDP